MSEKPKNMKAYFDSAKARHRKELTDKLRDLGERISQAQKRKEYYTTVELQKEFMEAKKALDDMR